MLSTDGAIAMGSENLSSPEQSELLNVWSNTLVQDLTPAVLISHLYSQQPFVPAVHFALPLVMDKPQLPPRNGDIY